MRTNTEYMPVPVLAIHVKRREIPRLTQNPMEFTSTEIESYYVTPEDARAGPQTRKLSFSEAISKFIV